MNLLPNFTEVRLGGLTLWFSYTTPIAFKLPGDKPVVRRNKWGPTTGKHLNWIDSGDKHSRVDEETFYARWQEATDRPGSILG